MRQTFGVCGSMLSTKRCDIATSKVHTPPNQLAIAYESYVLASKGYTVASDAYKIVPLHAAMIVASGLKYNESD